MPYILNRRYKMSKKRMRRTEMYMTNKQHEYIKEKADRKEIAFSEMARRIIDFYMEHD